MKNEIAELKQQVPLLSVVGSKVRLEQRGAEYWGCCPFHNENTPSFAIKNKNGEQVFFCQGCGKGGDVVRFIEYIDNVTTKEAINKLRMLSGNMEWQEQAKKVQETFRSVADETAKEKFTLPADKWAGFVKALQANKQALTWLQDKRGVTAETALTLQLGFSQGCKGRLNPEDEQVRDQGWVLFPRMRAGHVVAVKMRSIVNKAFSQWTNMEPRALFNAETINALEPVFVTEGELDTAIMEQAGFRAVSMPNSTTKLTPEAKTLLKGASSVYLAGDNDGKVGNAAMRQLARELGENTFMLLWPDGAKDANQYFLEKCGGSIDKFQVNMQLLIRKAHSTPVEGFTSILERLRNTQGTDAGSDPNRLHFPIEAIDKMNYNPAGSVVVIYSTYSGTGKSVFTTQVMLHEAKRGEIVVVYSPELRDEGYLALIAAQTLGPLRDGGLDRAGVITQQDYNETARVLDKPSDRNTDFRFYVGHSLPESETDKVLDFVEQTIKVTGATRFVIDTLHRVIDKSGRESQTEAEGRVIKRLEDIGRKYGTIFVLVGQSNKEAEDIKEQRHDSQGVLRGSRELQDVSYGIYLLHRKRKPTADNPKQLLELETDLILKKDRGKGPGNAIVHLIYRPECSKFYELVKNDSSEPEGPPLTNDHDSDAGFGD